MSGQLPVQIDPIRLADEGVRLDGVLPGGRLARLREQTLRADQPVSVTLQFERTAQGERRLQGTLRTRVEVPCRRCLRPFELEINAQPHLLLLPVGEVEPEEGESLIIEGPLSLIDLVEEELLLAMPMFPGHAEGECEVALPETTGRKPATVTKKNPFAELRGFKEKNQDE